MSSADDRRRVVAGVAGTAIGLVGLGFVARLVVRERAPLADLLGDLRPGWLAAALLLGFLAMGNIGWTWGAIVRRLGGDLPAPLVLRGYFVGQLGKYVPGGVWGVVGRGEWARRGGVPRPSAYASTLLSMATAYLAACALALACLPARPWAPGTGALAIAVGALAPAGLALLHPRVLRAVTARAGRLARQGRAPRVPAWRVSFALVARQIPSWLLIAAATAATAAGLGVTLDPLAVALATAVAWVVGFLALPVPGGIGVREAVFVALLGGGGTVAAVALSARLVFVLVDLVGAAAAAAWVAAARSSSATLDR